MWPWILTFARLPLAAGFAVTAAVAVAAEPERGAGVYLVALVLAGLGDVTDMLDGWAARRMGLVSELGGLADPLADSLARLTMYFAAALVGWVWIGVPLVMAGRDILVAYVRIALARTGGKTSARISGKVKAIVQAAGLFAIVVVAALVAERGSTPALARAQTLIGAAVIVATGWSLVDYIRGGLPAIRQMLPSEGD